MKYILDTDPGHDDSMAIMLAIKAGLDISAITTVMGNSSIENTTRNARYILNLLDRNDIPVYSGASKPLEGKLVKAVVHGKSGLEGINPKNDSKLTNNAIEKILSIVKNNKDVTIIAIGPLTNIAQAIRKDKKLMSKVKEIVIMGGAINVPGNKSRVAEFNIFTDPKAADIVFCFPVKKTLVPLDVCNKVKLSLKDFKKIKGDLKKPVLSMSRPYISNIYKEEGTKAAFMYDPLTIYYLINPKAYLLKKVDILVETKGEITKGMTVADLRKRPERKNIVDVVTHIKEEDFKRDFINYLSD